MRSTKAAGNGTARDGKTAATRKSTSHHTEKARTATTAALVAVLMLLLLVKNVVPPQLSAVNTFSLLALPIFCFDDRYISALLFCSDLQGFRKICRSDKAVFSPRSTTHEAHPLTWKKSGSSSRHQAAHAIRQRMKPPRFRHLVDCAALRDLARQSRPSRPQPFPWFLSMLSMMSGHESQPRSHHDKPPERGFAAPPADHAPQLAPELGKVCESFPGIHHRSTANRQHSNSLLC